MESARFSFVLCSTGSPNPLLSNHSKLWWCWMSDTYSLTSVLSIPVLACIYNSCSVLQSHVYYLWLSLWLPTSKWVASRESRYRRWQVILVSLLHPRVDNPTLPCLHNTNFLCTLQQLHQVLLHWHPYVLFPTWQQPHISLPACLQAGSCNLLLVSPLMLLAHLHLVIHKTSWWWQWGLPLQNMTSCFITASLSNRDYNPNYLS